MVDIFTQVSLIILIVLAVSLIMRMLKQPLIIGYIIAGIIAGPFAFGVLPSSDTIGVFSQLGVAFLLFIVGLHLSPKIIKEVGKISLITGIGQMGFTFIIGYFISMALGYSSLISMYISIAITFSSTIIIIKLLSDKGDLYALYGKISIGFLLVQDIVAIIILIVISSLSSGGSIAASIGLTIIKGSVLIAVLAPISMFVLPRLQKFFGRSQEFLFVFSIAWGLGLASVFYFIGLSVEAGALIAGILLSVSPYSVEISSRMKPLRDFFLIYFFIFLGAQMTIGSFSSAILPAIVLSLFVLIGKPLVIMALMALEGYTKKTNFQTGLTSAQISEFSLIIIVLAARIGHLSPDILSLMTIIGLITIAGSTYMMMYSDKIYRRLEKYLGVFERKDLREKDTTPEKVDAVLLGYNRIGFRILSALKNIKKDYLVIDYNPDVIDNLKRLRIPALYGDAGDEDMLNELPLEKVELFVSTIPEFETNELLVKSIRAVNKKAIVIVRAHTIQDALDLYKAGTSYVLTPHFLGGEYVARMLSIIKMDEKGYEEEKDRHIRMLKDMLSMGEDETESGKS